MANPVAIKRGDLSGHATAIYIPRSGRAACHYADTFSSGLWLPNMSPEFGNARAHDFARALGELVPEGTGPIVECPRGPAKVRPQPDEEEPAWNWREGMLEREVAELRVHTAVVVDYCERVKRRSPPPRQG